MTPVVSERPFRIRWLGKVRYRDALILQQRIHGQVPAAPQDHLLLLEHFGTILKGPYLVLELLLLLLGENMTHNYQMKSLLLIYYMVV